jgi:hypothetical protein
MDSFRIGLVENENDLHQLHQLHLDNLRGPHGNLSDSEAEKEGFVSAEYSIEFLRMMNQTRKSVIAKDGEPLSSHLHSRFFVFVIFPPGDLIVGYVLVAIKSELYGKHKLLDSLYDAIDEVKIRGVQMKLVNYVVVGQLCVRKGFRGKGVVNAMYAFFKSYLQDEFVCAATDISTSNPRSLRAHLKCGFQVVDSLVFEDSRWDVVVWDWLDTWGGKSLTLIEDNRN